MIDPITFTKWQDWSKRDDACALFVPSQIRQMLGEIERLRSALEDVIDPLAALKRYADSEGRQLSGMAYQIANDLSHVQRTAHEALAQSLG